MDIFWMVWKENGNTPVVKHKTEESAYKESERLARSNPGQVFHVLKSIDSCRTNDVVWSRRDDIPF